MPQVLRFGIHSLDVLLGSSASRGKNVANDPKAPKETPVHGIHLPEVTTTSVCIVGPSGTGKSIFALHLASTYLADCVRARSGGGPGAADPKVLYVSTDLTHDMANKVWTRFALDRPEVRSDPFAPKATAGAAPPRGIPPVKLKKWDPTGLAECFDKMLDPADRVDFIDFASSTAGDDWGFLHRLLSLLPERKKGTSPPHLVVVDAVEGFEALVGDVNAFGERSSRRSRVAQVMRLVAKKCHLVLVVEESETANQEAEEFITDAVIQLANVEARNYERRVLRINKARGQSHVRGWHHYSIRSGAGSSTGRQVNADDPEITIERAPSDPPATGAAGAATGPSESGREIQSYVQVFHSIHRTNRRIMEAKAEENLNARGEREPEKKIGDRNLPDSAFAAFGIKYLDSMLGEADEATSRRDAEAPEWGTYDVRGLPYGSTTALIGDSLTQKSTLGKAFLSRSFSDFDRQLDDARRILASADTKPEDATNLITRRLEFLADENESNWKGSVGRIGDLVAGRDWPGLVAEIEKIVPRDAVFDPPSNASNGSQIEETRPPEEPSGGERQPTERLLTQIAAWTISYDAGVAVMLSTHNFTRERLAKTFADWHRPARSSGQNTKTPVGYDEALLRYVERGTIARRLEIHNMSSEILMHIIQQAIRAAQRKVIRATEIEDGHARLERSWCIRVVLDDFSTFRDMFPELHEDPLLLPTILFHFEREGVTTLILDTQSGKPETPVAERFESELRKMVQHKIYTWRVPFYGESRVAVTAIPPFSHQYAGIVRELRWETDSSERGPNSSKKLPEIDPHFELYTGLEEGKPHSVRLQVKLYAETAAMEEYIRTENVLLDELFVPEGERREGGVLVGVPSTMYNEFRDATHFQRDTRLDHTVVYQIDEFWSMRSPNSRRRAGTFHPQGAYLEALTNPDLDPHTDPFRLYQPRASDEFVRQSEAEIPAADDVAVGDRPSAAASAKVSRDEVRRRHFHSDYYRDFIHEWPTTAGGSAELIDRVPFMWDFGFLLCQKNALSNCERKVRDSPSLVEHQQGEHRIMYARRTVKEVWDEFTKAQETDAPGKNSETKPVTWRIFAEAISKAAEERSERLGVSIPAFDFAQISPESFSCLVLEMWFSEIYETLERDYVIPEGQSVSETPAGGFAGSVSHRSLFVEEERKDKRAADPEPLSLTSLLKKHRLELYKVWLLLIEMLDLPSIVGESTALNFDFKSKSTDFSAVASRHWYKTATQYPNGASLEEPLVAVRLPGRFSVRGDWFLATSGSSRSLRQAEKVQDLLNSRRANVTRMQMGIGLPTRFHKSEAVRRLRTKLISYHKGEDYIEYETLLKIGAQESKTDPFYWLWRSRIVDYSSQNRIWHRWLNRMLFTWHRHRQRYKSTWSNSYEIYDRHTLMPPANKDFFAPSDEKIADLRTQGRVLSDKLQRDYCATSFAQLTVRNGFSQMVDALINELRQATES